MNRMILGGALTLTVSEEGDEDHRALLTTRGKDHDMTIDDLKSLVEACYQALEVMQKAKLERELPAVLVQIQAKVDEYLAPCAPLRVIKDRPFDQALILVPVDHPIEECFARMDRFEEWWFDFRADIDVIVDLDYRDPKAEQ